MNVLQNDKIELKRITRDDLYFLFDLRNNLKVCETIVYEAHTFEEQIYWFENLKNAEHFIIFNKDERVGTIGIFDIHQIHRRAKWTMRISPARWRQGYAREAMKLMFHYVFNICNLNKISGDCFAENFAEINNLTSYGFEREGIWRDHYFHLGKYRDSINFSLTKKKYESLKCM